MPRCTRFRISLHALLAQHRAHLYPLLDCAHEVNRSRMSAEQLAA